MAKVDKALVMNLIEAKRRAGESDDKIFGDFLKRKDNIGKNTKTLVNRHGAAGVSDPKAQAARYFGLDITTKSAKKKDAPKGLIGRSGEKLGALGDRIVDNIKGDGGLSNAAGTADAALAAGSGLIDMSLSGMSGIGGMAGAAMRGQPIIEGYNQGESNYNSSGAARALKAGATPRTATGSDLLNVLGIIDDGIVAAGDASYEATGSPAVGAGVQTGLNALGMFTPGKKGARISPTEAAPRPTARPTLTPEQVRARVLEADAMRAQRAAAQQTPTSQARIQAPVQQAPINPTARSTGNIDSIAAQLDAPQPMRAAVQAPPTLAQTQAATRSTGPIDNVVARFDEATNGAPVRNIDDTASPFGADPIPENVPPSPVSTLLDLDTSRPQVGGVPIELQGTRAQVLRDIGIPDELVRQGSITGDITALEREKAMSKADTPQGLAIREGMDVEYQRMNDYANNIIEDSIGARAGASPESRGQVVIDALEGYKDWYANEVKADYAKADAATEGKGGIKLSEFEQDLKTPSNWVAKDSNKSLRNGIRSYLKELNLMDADGSIKPMSARQAESLRQYINTQWSPDSAGLISRVNGKIDNGVFQALDDNAYVAARKRYQDFKKTFENPKGIASILESDGINRKTSAEQVGRKLQLLADKDGAQFKHIYDSLDAVPDALKGQAARAKSEIQATIAESVLGKKGLKSVNSEWMKYRRTGDDGNYKARDVFGEEVAGKLDTYVAGRNVLQHVDPNPSGTATTIPNIDRWNSGENAAGAGMGIAGAAMTGGSAVIGVAAGLAGKAVGRKFKQVMAEKQNVADFNQSINPKRAEVYREVNKKRIDDVIDSAEMQALIDEFENPAPKETKLKILQKKLTLSPEWKAYVKTLPAEARQAAMNSAEVLTMLTQGANSQDNNSAALTSF
ncbi:hypothetical protein ACTXLJ_05430 [Psychrobacter celer]|uniref:hypothetical protein n=1 Tax=Psychrobacter celer TaxID=306572 RepID=UPI003FD27081